MKKRILIIEDEAAVAQYLGIFLEQQGFEVHRASTLAQGRALAPSGYHLILLDLVLPDGTGDELLPYLRETVPDSPVLMVTGMGPDDERLVKCLQTGARGCISKGARVDELLASVRRVLRE